MSYTALIFDLDNTLVDRDAAAHWMFEKWLQTHRPQQLHLLPEIIARDNHGYAHPPAFMDWFRATFDLRLDNQAFFDSIRGDIIAALRPYSGIEALLDRLRVRYKLALLTNGHATGQMQKLTATGLDRYFAADSIFVSGKIGVHKPAPGAFAPVLAHLDLAPETVLMIGDDPRNDIAGGQALGLGTCWISHGRNWEGTLVPHHTVTMTTELENWLL